MKIHRSVKVLLLIILIAAAQNLYAGGLREKPLKSYNFYALGTNCTLSLYGGNMEQFKSVETLVKGFESRMSINIYGSEVSRINSKAGVSAVKVSDDVYKVIKAGLYFSEISNGAFDISIGPLVSLWDINNGGYRPKTDEIKSALSLVDHKKVNASDNKIYLAEKGMSIEPGGIAKGYAADAAAGYLDSIGVRSGLINFGGNVLAIGKKQNGSKWRIGIQNPDASRGSYIGIVAISDRSIVTSGKYERFFIGDDGQNYHHILDTQTGYPVENGIAQVSIIASGSMTADAMSTAVFLLGMKEGLKLAESIDGVESIIIMENNDIYITAGLKNNFTLTDKGFTLVKQ